MKQEGPPLDPLLHRLTDCPAEFLDLASKKNPGGVDVVAIACDLLRPLDSAKPPELETDFLAVLRGCSEPELALTSIICWLLGDAWFVERPQLAPRIRKLLSSDAINRLSRLVRPEKFVQDADRREELVRFCLSQLELRPRGETMAQASDRLTTLDSTERDRVLRATMAAEKRAREIREAMARKKAQESASRYGE